ncbi:hypothetical protein FA13DRAFT_1740550 [Coprinellus micaceus]|uniref:BTB domain-containing protein n=1 Tax=Coprinellus micaceus TaxID=71717 RepID=A0A4Y7SML5_COPMI|nr:hypothetical protein FA13DRAFT_1740550 [Coprinellus micaceus]
MIIVPESAAVLNIIIHTIYNSPCAQNSPKFEELIEAVDKMPLYGLTPNTIILPKSPMHDLLLAHGALRPLDIYALAAYHNIPSLAEKVSSHLLGFSLSNINDEMACRIGAPYLRRLFLLHTNRLEELKRILPKPPYIHPATEDCSFESQAKLARAWAMGATHLAWEMRPDLSIHTIKSVLESLKDKLKCTDCQAMLEKRIHEVLTRWAAVKCTISLE